MCRFFFIFCIYLYCRRISICQEGEGGVTLTDLIQPHICTCPNIWPGCQSAYFIGFLYFVISRDRRGRDRIVVGFITTYAIRVYHCEFEPRSGEVNSIQHYLIKFASDLLQVGVFFSSISVSSTHKTDRNDITEILLEVA